MIQDFMELKDMSLFHKTHSMGKKEKPDPH